MSLVWRLQPNKNKIFVSTANLVLFSISPPPPHNSSLIPSRFFISSSFCPLLYFLAFILRSFFLCCRLFQVMKINSWVLWKQWKMSFAFLCCSVVIIIFCVVVVVWIVIKHEKVVNEQVTNSNTHTHTHTHHISIHIECNWGSFNNYLWSFQRSFNSFSTLMPFYQYPGEFPFPYIMYFFICFILISNILTPVPFQHTFGCCCWCWKDVSSKSSIIHVRYQFSPHFTLQKEETFIFICFHKNIKNYLNKCYLP